MTILFINLSQFQISAILFAYFVLVLFATSKVMKYEKGIAILLWTLGIILVPPLLTIVYIVRAYFIRRNLEKTDGRD